MENRKFLIRTIGTIVISYISIKGIINSSSTGEILGKLIVYLLLLLCVFYFTELKEGEKE